MPGRRPMTEEQRARLEQDVATRDALKVKPPMAVTYGPETGMAYLPSTTVDGIRGEEGEFPTHVWLVPRKKEGILYIVPADSEGDHREKLTGTEDGAANCFFRAAMVPFELEEVKDHNMHFAVTIDEDSPYGYALAMHIRTIGYVKIQRRTGDKKKQKAAPTDQAAGGSQPAGTSQAPGEESTEP